jgi:two-component system sensor histidine kinase TctE
VIGRIGSRFEKSAASRTHSAGLGLSIARAVAEAFAGELVLSASDRGFRAALRLPLRECAK